MQQRSEETRSRILEAANLLFSTRGYEATGVAEICEAAKVSKGAFYHHFPTKQAVFLALMENWLEGLDQAFDAIRQNAGNVSQAIVHMANMAGRVLQEANVQLSIILEFWMQAHRDPAIWQAAAAPYQKYQTYFSALVKEGIADGSLRPVDPEHAARVMVSFAMGLLMQAVFDPQATDWAEEARESLQLLLDGLSKEV